MSSWPTLLKKPEEMTSQADWDNWFERITSRLLKATRLVVKGEPHRFVEIEVYYHGAGHLDPATHKDAVQKENGRWYFHRTRGEYRGGSFKGLDLTFGDGEACAGILIRGIEAADGTMIDGPSLSVDHLLARSGSDSVAQFDQTIAGRLAWEASSPLALHDCEEENRPIVRSGRVGLSLKRNRSSAMQQYLLRPYRYLTEPRRTAKGKPYLVLAQHIQGMSPEEIHEITGCPSKTVARYIEDFEQGRKVEDLKPYFGINLSTKALCQLHGTWYERVARS